MLKEVKIEKRQWKSTTDENFKLQDYCIIHWFLIWFAKVLSNPGSHHILVYCHGRKIANGWNWKGRVE